MHQLNCHEYSTPLEGFRATRLVCEAAEEMLNSSPAGHGCYEKPCPEKCSTNYSMPYGIVARVSGATRLPQRPWIPGNWLLFPMLVFDERYSILRWGWPWHTCV